MTKTRRLLSGLRSPDPVGRDLALYRVRAYRFTDDRRHYVLAEQLEERYLDGIRLRRSTVAYVEHCLDALRHGDRFPAFSDDVVEREDIDVTTELATREPYGLAHASERRPRKVVAIVGAPRSGVRAMDSAGGHPGLWGVRATMPRHGEYVPDDDQVAAFLSHATKTG